MAGVYSTKELAFDCIGLDYIGADDEGDIYVIRNTFVVNLLRVTETRVTISEYTTDGIIHPVNTWVVNLTTMRVELEDA